ncbi:hypothetical protein Q75_09725 [Bacillus coahuilensis p1.1.43]|uniref:Uncharacterized protein n=1 Tax=Bacillus coahuilensis p1.1.43 TaxID=1150625 RepID=A0A147K7S0_9BACI|nr:hypothetical protein [Bacillus coahuilensis]KUP06199.1 hypothetical protein Q75_09725 [Bacillus coahuilensis p1.1.43]
MIKRDLSNRKTNRSNYEAYLRGYEQYKKDRDYQHLQKLYNEAKFEAERKALARALYQMEIE